MPHRVWDNSRKFLHKTPTPSTSQPSFFFGDFDLPFLTIGELENPMGDPPKIFEEPVMEEEEPTSPIKSMVDNITKGVFPIIETNGETRMKKFIPSSFPHLASILMTLTLSCFILMFSDEQNIKLLPLTLKDATLH